MCICVYICIYVWMYVRTSIVSLLCILCCVFIALTNSSCWSLTVIHSFIYSSIHFIHARTHSHTHTLIFSYTHNQMQFTTSLQVCIISTMSSIHKNTLLVRCSSSYTWHAEYLCLCFSSYILCMLSLCIPLSHSIGTINRTLIGTINLGTAKPYPFYQHSFGLTENYVIISDCPCTFGNGWRNFQWLPQFDTTWRVVDRKTGIQVATFDSDAFFMMHHVNSYEKGNKVC